MTTLKHLSGQPQSSLCNQSRRNQSRDLLRYQWRCGSRLDFQRHSSTWSVSAPWNASANSWLGGLPPAGNTVLATGNTLPATGNTLPAAAKRTRRRWRSCLGLGVMGLTLILFFAARFPAHAPAQEPFIEFLEALREAGHFDVAENYLAQMEREDWVDAGIKKQIPFRRAQVLFEKTRTLTDRSQVIEAWKEAAALAESQAKNGSELDQRIDAVSLMTQIRIGLADFYRRESELSIKEIHTNAEAAQQVRQEFEKAAEAFGLAADMLLDEIREAVRSKDASRRAAADSNKLRFLSALLSKMSFLEQAASTYPPDSQEFKSKLETLAGENAALAGKYNVEPFPMYFKFNQAKCLVQLGKTSEASPLLDDILLLTREDYRLLQREAVLLGMEVWFEKEPYKTEVALVQLIKVAETLSDLDLQKTEAQQVLVALAKAHRQRTIDFKAIEKPTSQQRSEENVSQRAVGQLLRQVAKLQSPVAQDARQLMAEWEIRGPGEVADQIDSFVEARQAGFEVMTSAAELQVELAAAQADPDRQAEVESLQGQMNDLAEQALAFFDQALRLADESTTRADLNSTRLYQAQCYWFQQRYLDTVVIGNFLLDHYPKEFGTPEAAALAAQALAKLAGQGRDNNADVSFEQSQMRDTCSKILDRFPERKEAGDVAYLLIDVAIQQNDFASAQAALSKLSADNPRRPAAELLLGLNLRRQAKILEQSDNRSAEDEAQIAAYSAQSFNVLTSALGAPTEDFSVAHFFGAAALAEMLNEQGKFQEVITLLENSPTAGLKRVVDNDPLVQDTNVQTNLIQSGLIAYLGQMNETGDVAGAIDRGSELLRLLEEKLAADPNREQSLQGFYSLTLKNLKEQATKVSDQQQVEQLAEATLKIFRPLTDRSSSWRLLYNVGNTLVGMSADLETDREKIRQELNQVGLACFEKALQVTEDSNEENIGLFRDLFQLESAIALRGLERFPAALEKLQKLLVEKSPLGARIQIELCELHQRWGEVTKDKSKLVTAINGGLKGPGERGRPGKDTMIGWQKLAQATIGDAEKKDLFYQSLYGIASSRFSYGVIGGEQKFVEAGLSSISKQLREDPAMGGPLWFARFDALAKKIQTELKQTASGLAGLKP